MSEMTIRITGGFHGSEGPPGASDSLRSKLAAADAADERQDAADAARRRERAVVAQETAVRASIAAAQERGELVDVRRAYRDGGVGRAPREAIEHASALMDIEDQRAEAAQRRAYRQWQVDQGLLEAPQPSDRELEVAARTRTGPPEEVGAAVRSRWLRRNTVIQ